VFAFSIQPPWWRAWWLLALAAAAALALMRGIWRWRVSWLVRRQKELEGVVAERTQELRREKQDLLAARESLREQAVKDGLTGLFNHRAFFDLLEREFARMGRRSSPLAFVMADLDLFKTINDSYGHLAGDAVLQECARRVVAAVRPYDIVARYGGEELAILMPGCHLEKAAERAEQVRRAITQKPIVTPGGSISVTCSLGVAAATGQATKLEELVQSADRALYCAKDRGRNCVVVLAGGAFVGVEELTALTPATPA
jgi:diguanylate cyclase (GGDEF)-like protein